MSDCRGNSIVMTHHDGLCETALSFYLGKTYVWWICRLQDWKQHKPSCLARRAQSGAASASSPSNGASSSSNGTQGAESNQSLLVQLEENARAPFSMTNISFRSPMEKAFKDAKAGIWKDGKIPKAQRKADPSKKFIVKIQAPMEPVGAHRVELQVTVFVFME
jgi:hypothetical protein